MRGLGAGGEAPGAIPASLNLIGFLIPSGRAGRPHAGMTVEEFYSSFGRRDIRLVDEDLC
jgi:hypothetical protein